MPIKIVAALKDKRREVAILGTTRVTGCQLKMRDAFISGVTVA
jgi:hypothetical protein